MGTGYLILDTDKHVDTCISIDIAADMNINTEIVLVVDRSIGASLDAETNTSMNVDTDRNRQINVYTYLHM